MGTANLTGTFVNSNSGLTGQVNGQGALTCTPPNQACTGTVNVSETISGGLTGPATGSATINCGAGGEASPTPVAMCTSTNSAIGTGTTQMLTASLTGFGWTDNSPPNSAIIAHPILNQTAGGDGSACNPITFGTQIANSSTIPYGTLIYIPSLQRYFIREDDCNPLGCPDGSTTGPTFNVWVGGTSTDTASAITQCESSFTQPSAQITLWPALTGLPVTTGPIFSNGTCKSVAGA